MEQFAAVKRKDGQPVRYLVVDDSVFARKNLARIIETFGGKLIGEAGDGKTAITEYDRLKPDIVLMDITMPQMDGLTCLTQLLAVNPAVRVIVISALADPATGLKALKLGAKSFLPKPFTETQLVDEIRRVAGVAS